MSESFDDVIRDYIDFVNLQVGVYIDALAGFAGHKVRVERQIFRINRVVGRSIDEAGQPIMLRASYEDPTKPDVIHNRIMRADDYVEANSENGVNVRQHSYAVLVFLFSYWEHEIRPRLARAKRVELTEVKSDIMGDLRILRQAILHTKAILKAEDHKKLKMLGYMFLPDQVIYISNENMHKIFVLIKQGLGSMLFSWLGVKDISSDLVDFAIQKSR